MLTVVPRLRSASAWPRHLIVRPIPSAVVRGISVVLVALAVSAVVVVTTASTATARSRARGPWRHVTTSQGVRVSTRDIPGQDFPEFRGVMTMKADIFQLLAVLNDASRHCEWQASCKVMRIIKRYDAFNRVLYHRLDSPWPVSDRDVVIRGGVTVDLAKKVVWSRFRAVSGMVKPKSGVVRINRMNGSFKFELLAPGVVRATYQVFSDPGGWLPTWLVVRASKKIPLRTLVGLQAQVNKTKSGYLAFHRRYNPALGGTIPTAFQTGGKSARGVPDAAGRKAMLGNRAKTPVLKRQK